MYRIRFNSIKKNYEFDKNNVTVDKGSLLEIVWTALEEGVQSEGLEHALVHMAENEHTVAEFGIDGCFLFSK